MTWTDNARRRAATGIISVTMLLLVAFATGCEDGLTGLPTGEGERRDADRETAVFPIDAPLYSRGGNGLKTTTAKGGKPDRPPKDDGGGTDSTATDSPTTDSTTTDGGGETPAEPAAVASVSVAPSSATLEKGTTRQFTAKLYDASGNELTGRTVSWMTSNSLIATVSGAGLVSALAAGSATITARSEDKSGSAAVTVTNPVTTGPSNWISPGEDIQAKVDAHPAGTAFLLKAGVHREQRVVPKAGMSFTGEPGAVMNGAKLLTKWSGSGPWYVSDQTFLSVGTAGSCRSGYPMCKDPNDVFIDDKPQLQVSTLGEVGPGKFYNDRANGRVYIGTNPSGRKVEFSSSGYAFKSGTRAHNVTIRNLVIEKYANKGQYPVIDPRHSTSGTASSSDFGASWIVENNVIRWNHGMGVRSWNGHIHRNNYVHDNGQLGLGGQGTDVLIIDNEIARNGEWAGYSAGFEAGGTKWTRTVRLTVRNNYSHHNFGDGLWTDIDNIYTLYENNRVEHNRGAGIFHEISYDAVIRYNTVKWNSLESGRTSLRGSGILVTESPNVEIYGNEVIENWNGIGFIQQDRGSGPHGPYEVRNAWVHDNVVVNLPDRGYSGITGSSTKTWLWNGDGNNRFDRNRYKVSSSTVKAWSWNGVRNWTELRSAGQEPNGQVAQ